MTVNSNFLPLRLENYPQTMVKANGRTTSGSYKDLVSCAPLSFQTAHECYQECQDAGTVATLSPTLDRHQATGSPNDLTAANRLLCRWHTAVCRVVIRWAELLSDTELKVEVFDVAFQRDDQERGAVHERLLCRADPSDVQDVPDPATLQVPSLRHVSYRGYLDPVGLARLSGTAPQTNLEI